MEVHIVLTDFWYVQFVISNCGKNWRKKTSNVNIHILFAREAHQFNLWSLPRKEKELITLWPEISIRNSLQKLHRVAKWTYKHTSNCVYSVSKCIEDCCIRYKCVRCWYTHVVDPGDVGGHTGENGRLLVIVAAHTGAKAYHTINYPGTIRSLTVQRATRVTLYKVITSKVECACVGVFPLSVL